MNKHSSLFQSTISDEEKNVFLNINFKEVDSAKVLNLKCSDMFFHESQLKPEHFGSLPNLEKLSIDFCKIRHVPARAFAGLSGLKSLRLQSHNADWSSVLMDIDMDSFKRLTALEELNLAQNNLW